MITRTWRQSLGLAVIFLMLGLFLTLQVRTQDRVQLTRRAARVSEDLVAQFLKVTQENEKLRTERQELTTQQSTATQLGDELELARAAAGLLEVQGPGVTVTMADLSDTSARQVTADDIMLVLNELRAGGAEAMAINGQRVTSRLRVARDQLTPGAPLRINDLLVSGPITITAVGDPATLVASLQMRGGVISVLTPWLHIDVQPTDALTVPIASEPAYQYARPASGTR